MNSSRAHGVLLGPRVDILLGDPHREEGDDGGYLPVA